MIFSKELLNRFSLSFSFWAALSEFMRFRCSYINPEIRTLEFGARWYGLSIFVIAGIVIWKFLPSKFEIWLDKIYYKSLLLIPFLLFGIANYFNLDPLANWDNSQYIYVNIQIIWLVLLVSVLFTSIVEAYYNLTLNPLAFKVVGGIFVLVLFWLLA